MVAALERIGIDAGSLLARTGITRGQLDDPDARVPCEPYTRLLALAQQEMPRENLALRLAQVTPMGAYPLIDYLVLSSETVGEGLRRLSRYYRLVSPMSSLVLHTQEDPIRVDVGAAGLPFAAEFSVAIMLLHLRRESAGRAVAAWVSFMRPPVDAAAYERALGCPVRVHEAWNGCAMTKDVWNLPMRRRDPVLIRLLEPQADVAVAAAATPETLVVRVSRALAHGLAGGNASIASVARVLALSPRTLQRRLTGEGVSFQRLLDDTRRGLADRHLSDSALAIAEIAFLLGYSEPAAFHRAFKRWHAVTPQEFRARRST